MIGLARAFIAAGSPMVAASLWAVEANATDTLMVNFHRRRVWDKDKISSSKALRFAQLDMLKNESTKHPYYWAGFVTVGGETTF